MFLEQIFSTKKESKIKWTEIEREVAEVGILKRNEKHIFVLMKKFLIF